MPAKAKKVGPIVSAAESTESTAPDAKAGSCIETGKDGSIRFSLFVRCNCH